MRLFVAINFDEAVKESLTLDIEKLKSFSIEGNFTRKENLHLTIAFIGETNRVKDAADVLKNINMQPFALSINGFGSFRRNGGDIYWRGIKPNQQLDEVYEQVYNGLTEKGFALEDRPFKPHLTLGRRVIVSEKFNFSAFKKSLLKITAPIKRVSLMKSERINGKLCYTEVFGVDLH